MTIARATPARPTHRAFTLLEVLVALAVLGALVGLVTPALLARLRQQQADAFFHALSDAAASLRAAASRAGSTTCLLVASDRRSVVGLHLAPGPAAHDRVDAALRGSAQGSAFTEGPSQGLDEVPRDLVTPTIASTDALADNARSATPAIRALAVPRGVRFLDHAQAAAEVARLAARASAELGTDPDLDLDPNLEPIDTPTADSSDAPLSEFQSLGERCLIAMLPDGSAVGPAVTVARVGGTLYALQPMPSAGTLQVQRIDNDSAASVLSLLSSDRPRRSTTERPAAARSQPRRPLRRARPRRQHARHTRRAAVLLEVMLAMAVLAGVGLAVLSVTQQSTAGVVRALHRAQAADLARSALALIDAGLATPPMLDGRVPANLAQLAADPSDGGPIDSTDSDRTIEPLSLADDSPWVLSVTVQPSAFPGLALVTVRADRRLSDTAEQSQAFAELHQLVRFDPDTPNRSTDDWLSGVDQPRTPTIGPSSPSEGQP